MAGTDFFGPQGAAGNIDAEKAATLQAVAQGGSAAKQAFTSGQAANQAAMGSAVKTAIAQAIGARAPAGFLAGVTPTVSTPYQQANDTLGKLGADRSQFFQNAGTLQGNFFNNMKAAEPVVERMYEARIAGINEKAQQAAQDRALRQQDLALRIQSQQDKAAKVMTPADIIRALGGPKMAADTISNYASGVPASKPNPNPTFGGYGPQPTIQQQAATNRTDALHTIGGQLGMSPEEVDSLLQVTAPPAAKAPTAEDIRTSPGYPAALSDASSKLAGGMKPAEAVRALAPTYGAAAFQIVSDALSLTSRGASASVATTAG